jgi:hypothetical protein
VVCGGDGLPSCLDLDDAQRRAILTNLLTVKPVCASIHRLTARAAHDRQMGAYAPSTGDDEHHACSVPDEVGSPRVLRATSGRRWTTGS